MHAGRASGRREHASAVGERAALLAGAAWLLTYIYGSIDLAGMVAYLALACSLVGMLGIRQRFKAGCRVLGSLSLGAALVGASLWVLPEVLAPLGVTGLFNVAFQVCGLLILACAYVMLGVAILRAKVLPVLSGPLLVGGGVWLLVSFFYYLAFPILSELPLYDIALIAAWVPLFPLESRPMSASIVLGIVWLALAYALRSRRGAPKAESSGGTESAAPPRKGGGTWSRLRRGCVVVVAVLLLSPLALQHVL